MARALGVPRHRTLADVLRSAGRRKQGVGKKRGPSGRVHLAKEF